MNSSLLIKEISVKSAPVDLLLIADPSRERVLSYLSSSKCFVVMNDENLVAACVVKALGCGSYELMSIAVDPSHQRLGYGTMLLKWVLDYLRRSGASRIEVGTGTLGYPLAFYQKNGFRVQSIDHDFFINNYPEPVFEDGVQLFDMIRLAMELDSGK